MDNRLRKDYTVLTSSCDAEGLLGLRNIFDICMDLAAEHAAELGVGYYDMLDKRCFWVAVRTRVRIYERPKLGSHITTETWPGKPGRAKSDRYYRLSAEELGFFGFSVMKPKTAKRKAAQKRQQKARKK